MADEGAEESHDRYREARECSRDPGKPCPVTHEPSWVSGDEILLSHEGIPEAATARA